MASPSKKQRPLETVAPSRGGDLLFRGTAAVVRRVLNLVIKRSWTGMEKLPRDQGYIVVANHVTEVDPLTVANVVYMSGTIPRFLAKESLFRIPLVGAVLHRTAQIPVFRGSMEAHKSLESARSVIDGGGAVLIYPEGTLTKDPDLWPMTGRSGAARLAMATGAPVVPIAHWGEHEFLAPKATKPHVFPRKTSHVLVGDPIDLSDLRGENRTDHVSRDALNEATERMMDSLTRLVEELRGEKAPEGRWDPRRHRRVKRSTEENH
ncbi:lysophospholipid acyltransferase family protein [Curtobacterium sp. S6]|uniref:lysophospholipid acyltransferase family protein n=1 Tax=Curtobacterium sp. S6 TaxID=1479623 RepID=UPI00056D7FCB|nr:lysophospholipid acyltransferase family protein [Curtobacterium sp. S6]